MSFINIFKRYFSGKKEANMAASNEVVRPNLGELTVVQLKAKAKEQGLKGYSKLKKSELVRLLS
tara:strand:+ start:325 stop:516 length:192 start_codon:yes stop_codon:yes gene_type:complete